MWEVILESLLDSAKAAPFLLVVYLLIEFLENNAKTKSATVRLLNGKLAPLVASGVGLIPQCGFSVMATDLYNQRYLKTGTLIAFFVATSDEALPILLTNSQTAKVVWIVVVVKLVYALLLGYLINLLDKRKLSTTYQLQQEGCCGHEMHDHHHSFWHFVKHPLLHTLKIFLYLFAVNVAFGLLLYYFQDAIVGFASRLGIFRPFITSIIGLVPNCSASVILAGMFTNSLITLGSLIGGLVSSSGLAFVILFKQKGQLKRNLLILATMYLSGVLIGMITDLVLSYIPMPI